MIVTEINCGSCFDAGIIWFMIYAFVMLFLEFHMYEPVIK